MHIPYDLCIGTKRLGTFHRPCAFSSEASAHVHQLVQSGRRLWHKFFVRAHDYWPTYPNKIDQSESFDKCICTSTLHYHHSSHTPHALTRTFPSVVIQWLQRQRNKPLLRRMGNQSKLHHYLYADIHEYAIGFSLHTEQHLLRQASLILSKIRKLPHWLASEFQHKLWTMVAKCMFEHKLIIPVCL